MKLTKTTFFKSVFAFATLTLIAILAACGGSSSHSNPGGNTTPTIAISANSGYTASAATGGSFGIFSATVTSNGSPANGVSVTFTAPSSGASGTFADNGTSAATDTETTNSSGVATSTIFTANSTAGSYSVTATTSGAVTPATFSLTNSQATATSVNYVYHLSGWDTTDDSPYFISGVITVSGTLSAGTVTAGEQDLVDNAVAPTDLINPVGSTVTTTTDGNVQLVLNTCNGTDCTSVDTSVGVSGIETFNVSLYPSNPAKAFINEYDLFGSASGEINLQDSTAAAATPSAGYAFSFGGIDSSGFPLVIGGVINVDGAGTISGTGSIFDANDSGTAFQAETLSSSTVTAPDSFGRVEFTLNATDSTDFPQIFLVGYIVDSNTVRLTETTDSLLATTGGTARSQGANTGQFTSASFSGNSYVFAMNGYDTSFVLQTAGVLTASSSTISGFMDFNDLSASELTIPDPVSAPAYTVDPTGRVTITGLTDGTVLNSNIELYLDGNGQARAITLDGNDALYGVAFQQSGTGSLTDANFTGTYAQEFTGWDFNFVGEFDAVGSTTATGTADTTTGFVDLNWLDSGVPTFTNVLVSGTYAYNSSFSGDGVLTPGTITGIDLTNCPTFGTGTTCSADAFDYYLVNTTGDAVSIETDSNQLSLGYNAQ